MKGMTTECFKPLHDAYERLTGLKITLTMGRMFTWHAWTVHGWGMAELEMVIRRRQELIRQKKKWESSLLFRNLVEDVEGFEETLSEARALSRHPVVNRARTEVLKATGRTEPQRGEFKTSGEVMASPAFQAFVALKNAL